MRAMFRWLWKYIKQHPLLTRGIIIALIVFSLAVWVFGWDWTGLNGGYSQSTTTSTSHGTIITTEKPPGKTLWDVLQLLIVPILLVVGGSWLNQIQKTREENTTEQRAKIEREVAEKRAKTDRAVAEKHAQTEHDIASDNQREAALQAYLDKMSELLLHEDLGKSSPPEDVATIAQARTATVLRTLDPIRRASLILFLSQSGILVICVEKSVKGSFDSLLNNENSLAGIDLHGTNLAGANLDRINLVD
jgi:hypothetical protein